MDPKKYGLIRLSKVDKPKTTLKKNIFDSDSDEELPTDAKKITTSSGIKRQTQLDISRALTDDPNVFEYDSIYDQMKSQKESNSSMTSESKEKSQPKYINSLLKFSENRKKENERRIERKIQKERELEGNQFEDKEQFVTNAYKQKLNEMRAAEERDRREEAIEELLDVKKQNDLSGFYRHLLNNDISSQKKETTEESIDLSKQVIQEVAEQKPKIVSKPKTNRQFRRRMSSSEESSDETTQTIVDPKQVNKNESTNKAVAEDRDESLSESEDSEPNDKTLENKNILNSKPIKRENDSNLLDETNRQNKDPSEETNKIPKLNKRELLLKLFTKRTVGEAYTEAQMRYFQRKDNYVI